MYRTGKHAYTARTVSPATLRRHVDRRSVAAVGEPDTEAGFTLIEAIVSLTIFAIVTAAAISAIVTGIKSSNASRDRVTAANVAQQALNDSQALPVSSLAATPTTSSTTPVGGESYTVARQITVEASGPAAAATTPATCPNAIVTNTAYWLHVAVRVTWPGGPSAGIAMDTVRAC